MPITEFEDLEIWQLARVLTRQIYDVSNKGFFAKDFVLRDQIRRSALSVMSNIAEGFERGGNQEFIHFLSIAKGSCGEARSQMFVAVDQGYVDPGNGKLLIESFRQLSSRITNLMLYLKKSSFKGQKFKRTPA